METMCRLDVKKRGNKKCILFYSLRYHKGQQRVIDGEILFHAVMVFFFHHILYGIVGVMAFTYYYVFFFFF